jgi:phosphate uptake regulator
MPLMNLATRPSASTLERLVPIAEGIEAFTRESGRAFVEHDSELARELLAHGGERQRLDSELDAAWTELLSEPPDSVPASVRLMVSLRGIADLAATICGRVADIGEKQDRPSQPAMDRLAEMVPAMVQGAVHALRDGDPESAKTVLRQTVSADVAFAQTYTEVLQMVREDAETYGLAQDLHAISRAFERMGDGAAEIASRVRDAVEA